MQPRIRTAHIVVLALTGALLIALLLWDPAARPGGVQEQDIPEGAAGQAAPREPPAPRSPAPPRPRTADQTCEPHASKACEDGDVWWFDGCGEPQELAESCAARGCRAGACLASARPDPRCVQVSAYGVCEGDQAVACVDNRMLRVDCGAKGMRCVTTREGARCLPRDAQRGCSDRARASCVGERLRECVDGYWTEIDCAARKASCLADGDGARCGASPTPPTAAGRPPVRELCNGRDDDQDGQIDESDACKAVPLIAFVPQGARLSDLEARMASDLEIANRVFAPLQFVWAKQLAVSGDLRVVDPDRMENAARTLSQQESSVVQQRLHPADNAQQGLPFYIAVLFAERIRGEPPKGGVSTLPNSTCGGVRISDTPSPPWGLVVLADQRTPQSLSHELGHYLGLCHTHEELSRIAAATASLPSCKRTGDGICDTATDPGPDACDEVAPCDFYCAASSARPDAANLMGYYMHCRQAFSPEQLSETARVLELRRGWFRCLDPQDCLCEPAAASCPNEMSCHPYGPSFACELDGPGRPGTLCRNSSQCGYNAICMSGDNAAGRCIRPCTPSEDCTCRDVGLPFQVCAQDLG
ncbi:MAG TPA: M43 family zinc metalloprotease [Polyangiales bacterium]|nr:M43 family zinc metalloprotease [Polyangiales bacterium]